MENPFEPSKPLFGARFFDGKRHDLGWATQVSLRKPSLGGLTVLDVANSEPALARSLLMLDKSRLLVRCQDAAGGSWDFTWASGYSNGPDIRIQGVLAYVFGDRSA